MTKRLPDEPTATAALCAAMDAATGTLGLTAAEIQVITPKEVLLLAMRTCLKAGWLFRAAEIAADVAPYVHAKLSATTVNAPNDLEDMPSSELVAELEAIDRRARSAAETGNGKVQDMDIGDDDLWPGSMVH